MHLLLVFKAPLFRGLQPPQLGVLCIFRSSQDLAFEKRFVVEEPRAEGRFGVGRVGSIRWDPVLNRGLRLGDHRPSASGVRCPFHANGQRTHKAIFMHVWQVSRKLRSTTNANSLLDKRLTL